MAPRRDVFQPVCPGSNSILGGTGYSLRTGFENRAFALLSGDPVQTLKLGI
jgi:hypothetical protein